MAEEKSGLALAADRIRETAKWLTLGFAAIGAIMVAGSQLSSMGSLEVGSGRFWYAILGGAAASIGALAALLATAWTATTPAVTLSALVAKTPKGADSVVKDKGLLQGYADVGALSGAYETAVTDRKTALEAHYGNINDANLKNRAEVEENRAMMLHGIADGLVSVVAYSHLAHRWSVAVKWIVGGALVAAGGLGLFAWAANPPADAKASAASANVLTTPSSKTVMLTADGVEALKGKLGDGCDTAKSLNVLVLGDTPSGPDVLIDNDGCAVLRVVMTTAWGTVQ